MKKIIIITAIILSSLILPFFTFAQTDDIEATVNIGVCGNGIVEGTEQCEDKVPEGINCKTFGYDGGFLRCENSCSIDKKYCYTLPEIVEEIIKDVVSALPSFLKPYDENGDGIITKVEYCSGLDNWVGKWRTYIIGVKTDSETINKAPNSCDVNKDGACNLVDFSIFLSKGV